MNYAIKVLLRQPYHYLSKKEGRFFLKLCWQLGAKPRFTPMQIAYQGVKWNILDTWSFLWQYHDIFFKGAYLFANEKKAPLIIDCGANIGMSVKFFKTAYPGSRVIAFEPDSEVFELLQQNIGILENTELINSAVWIHSEGVSLQRNGSDTGRIGLEGEKVSSIRLKEVLMAHEEIDLLKMDIEGAEYDVLMDCADVLSRVKRLFIELHCMADEQQRVGELLVILQKSGFRYFLENENEQNQPLAGNWKVSNVGMDVQINLYAFRK